MVRSRGSWVILLSAVSFLCFACGDTWKCQSAGITCAKTGTDIQACCTDDNSKCKYVVSGKDYPCNGTDCAAEAKTLATYCAS
jgi:hypothetical protein